MKHKKLSEKYDDLAPDGSEIRLLLNTEAGGCCHCTLPAGKVSKAVKHKTVEEIWYILSGKGEMWQRSGSEEYVKDIEAGDCVTIPLGNHFQFRNTGKEDLLIVILTMPPWPGKEEAIPVDQYWKDP